MYEIAFSKQAYKTLRKLPRKIALRIQDKLLVLAADPFANNNNVKSLVSRPGYRLRMGDWRIIYTIDNQKLIVEVLAIASRGDIYQ